MSSLDRQDANSRARFALSLAATLVAASETPGWNEYAKRFARIVSRDDPAAVGHAVAALDLAVGNDPGAGNSPRDPFMIGFTASAVARYVFERITAVPDLVEPLDDLDRAIRSDLDAEARGWAETVGGLAVSIGDDGRLDVDSFAVPALPGHSIKLYPVSRSPFPAGEPISETEAPDADFAPPVRPAEPPAAPWLAPGGPPPRYAAAPTGPSNAAPPSRPSYGAGTYDGSLPPTAPPAGPSYGAGAGTLPGSSAPTAPPERSTRPEPIAPGSGQYGAHPVPSAPPAPGAPPRVAPGVPGAQQPVFAPPAPGAPAAPSAGAARSHGGASPVAEALRRTLRKGMLMFAAPDVMRQGRKERVEVGIARDIDAAADLDVDFRTHHQRVSDEIRTADFMTVELVGDAFDIRPLSPATQPVAPTAHWEFEVTPKQSGHQVLTLTATAVVSIDGAERTVAVPAFDRDIKVAVDFGYGTAQFLRGNWQWLVGTLVGLGGALAAWIALFS